MASKQNWDATLELLATKKALLDERKGSLRAEIKERVTAELAASVTELEMTFARDLRDAVEAGVPLTSIQRDVLRTNAWGAWVKWKSLADIPSVRDLAAAEKRAAAQKAKGWLFDPATRVLTLTKTADKFGAQVLDPAITVVVPSPLTAENLKTVYEWLMPKEDWYALGYPEKSWINTVYTIPEILGELEETGDLTVT